MAVPTSNIEEGPKSKKNGNPIFFTLEVGWMDNVPAVPKINPPMDLACFSRDFAGSGTFRMIF